MKFNKVSIIIVLILISCIKNIYSQLPGGVDSTSSGLTFWAKANTTTASKLILNAGNVSSWINEKNNFALTQATANKQPTLINTYNILYNFNFNPSIDFDKVAQKVIFNTSSTENMIGTDGTIFLVCNSTADGNGMTYKGTNNYKAQLKPNWRIQNGTAAGLGNTSDYGTSTGGPTSPNFATSSARIMAMHGVGPLFTSRLNSKSIFPNNTNNSTYNPSIQYGLYIGANNASEYWEDAVAEIIIFNTKLNAEKLNKIESYLAMKYGITLDSPTSYVLSDSTIVWNAINNALYHHNVTAIVRDDSSDLYQKQSRGVMKKNLVTIFNNTTTSPFPTMNTANSSTLINKSAFFIGDNNRSDSLRLCYNNYQTRMQRTWIARKNATYNTPITLSVTKSEISPNIKYLLVSTDSSFATNTQSYLLHDNGTNLYYSLSFTDSTFFTFASDSVRASFVANTAYCGNPNGSLTVTASGSSGQYSYLWNTSPTSTSNTITNQIASGYTVDITHAVGCTASFNASIPNTNNVLTAIATHVDEQCGQSNGSISINANGGTSPYTYSINGGSSFQTTNMFSNLAAGIYNIVIKDNKGCTNNVQFETIDNINIEPKVYYNISQPWCHGDSNATLQIFTLSGTLPFTFTNTTLASSNNNGLFTDMYAGTYLFKITDNLGCYNDTSITINEPERVEILDTVFPTCWLDPTGAVSLGGYGGIKPYEYSLDYSSFDTTSYIDSLKLGSHVIYMQDAHGCLDSTKINVTERNKFEISSIVKNISCEAFNSGSIELIITGTTSPYFYDWKNFPNEIFENYKDELISGTYRIEVRDADFCRDTINIKITNPCCTPVGPNAFTPNGDGQNDAYKLFYPPGMKLLAFRIYNRYGEQIFATNDPTALWDGKYKGKEVDMGTYFYIAEVICDAGNTFSKGSFDVIR